MRRLNTYINFCRSRTHDAPEIACVGSGQWRRSEQSQVKVAGCSYHLPAGCELKTDAACRTPIQLRSTELPLEPGQSRESGKSTAGGTRHARGKLRRPESLLYVGEVSEATPALVAVDAAYPCSDESVRSVCSTHYDPEIAGSG